MLMSVGITWWQTRLELGSRLGIMMLSLSRSSVNKLVGLSLTLFYDGSYKWELSLNTQVSWVWFWFEIMIPSLSRSSINKLLWLSLKLIKLLGICMRIRFLTRSTWKVRNGKAQSAGEMTPCCPLPIRSWVSERSKWLGWWRASRFLSPLSCLSSFCWAVNHLPYIWTRSGVVFYLPSPRPQSPCHRAMASWAGHAKRYLNYA